MLARLLPRPVGEGAQSMYWHAKDEPPSSPSRTCCGVSLSVQLFQWREYSWRSRVKASEGASLAGGAVPEPAAAVRVSCPKQPHSALLQQDPGNLRYSLP